MPRDVTTWPRGLVPCITIMCVLFTSSPARADITHTIMFSALGSFEGRWGLAYEVGWPGDATEQRLRSRLLLRGHVGAAYTSSQFGSDESGEPVTSASGASVWAGINLGWAGIRLANAKPIELAISAVIAPVITVFDQWATRLNIAIRPGLRFRYNYFSFSFGLSLEIPLATTDSGPWDDDVEPHALLPGADIALGVAF